MIKVDAYYIFRSWAALQTLDIISFGFHTLTAEHHLIWQLVLSNHLFQYTSILKNKYGVAMLQVFNFVCN